MTGQCLICRRVAAYPPARPRITKRAHTVTVTIDGESALYGLLCRACAVDLVDRLRSGEVVT